MIRSKSRRGFTLIELMVTMALIAFLAALAMVVAPAVLEKDRSVDAVSNLQGWLEISRARAARDRLPRGVRLIVNPVTLQATEAQYIESPPVLVFNINPPYPNSGVYTPNGVLNPGIPGAQINPLSARVEFTYTVAPGPGPGPPVPGSITNRQCVIRGLDLDQANTLVSFTTNGQQPTLWMPVLGTWHRIIGVGAVQQDPPSPAPATSYFVPVTLDYYPDTQLGATTNYVTYHFGVYGPPRPLLGEPTMQLPTETCVDLNAGVSIPGGVAFQDYDLLFAPGGQLAFTPSTMGASSVFLWVRNPNLPLNFAALDQGGEMMIIAIKAKSGAIGVAPVDHSGDPYALARQAVLGQ